MLRIYATLIFSLIINIQAKPQSVGLVLSGGGARGITHIGVIKALEDNNIPIDFITGTSMGAVVGSMYAMGYNMEEIIDILKSDDFKRWSTGEMDPNYVYYYRNADQRPGLVDFHVQLNVKDSVKVKSYLLPTNLISPIQMNYAFLELYSQATASSGGDFDKLLVPFRCVASDVYAKKEVVLSNGHLGDAVRASMTFPFVYKPISINDRLLFDGGIYNNFPVDVMKNDFQPEFIIGSVVSRNPEKPEEDDLLDQVTNMIMTRTDYTISEKEGVLFDFNLKHIATFDFSKVDELVKIGYDSTIAQINFIKSRVSRRVNSQIVEEKRLKFRSNYPELNFKKITVTGVNSLQKNYIESSFKLKDSIITLDEVKEKYFQLVSNDKISEVKPHAIYDSNTGLFDLVLNVRTQDQLKFTFGANVSSSTSNIAYFGVVHQSLQEFAQTSYADAQFGTMYNALGVGTRLDVLGTRNMYVKLSGVFHRFDYFKTNHLFFADDAFNESTQYEVYTKFAIGMPLTLKGRLKFGLGYGNLTDYYRQISSVTDRSIFNIGSAFLNIKSYTHNSLMYPTSGRDNMILLSMFGGNENFRSGNNALTNSNEDFELWGQLSAKYDQYFKLNKHLILGAQADLTISTRKMLSNYMVTLTQAPIFKPTLHSQTVFKPAFAANQFVALGIKPIYYINERFQWRNEVYVYAPYRKIFRSADSKAIYSDIFPTVDVIAETAFVFDFKVAKASAFVTYYSSTSDAPINLGINIGFILFNKKFMY